MKKLLVILFVSTLLISCEKKPSTQNNEEPPINFELEKKRKLSIEITNLFSINPLNEVKEFEINFSTPEDLIIRTFENEILKYISTKGSNRSGNLGGPSSITLNFDNEKYVFSIETKNTTGSMYTGWEVWEDTYYFSPMEFLYDLKVVDRSQEDENPRIAISSRNNPPSLRGTRDYHVEIIFKLNEPQYISIGVFGKDNNWNNFSRFWFKDSTEVERIFKTLVETANTKNIIELNNLNNQSF